MRWFPLTLLAGAFVASAQNPPSAVTPSDAEQKKIRLEGTIFSLNGEVIRKATVRLQGTIAQPGQLPTNYSESTDNEGKFVFEDVAAGRYTLSAEKGGFVTTRSKRCACTACMPSLARTCTLVSPLCSTLCRATSTAARLASTIVTCPLVARRAICIPM